MLPASTRLVPELNYYFSVFVRTSVLNKYRVTYPAVLTCPCLDENKSFIRLLFDDNWPKTYTTYRYFYREVNMAGWPEQVRTRLAIYPSSAKCYLSDSDPPDADNNLFNLEVDDLLLLNKLLEYRTSDDPSGVSISEIDYITLNTPISKMIFLYLDLVINGNYENYNTETLISSESSVLESCYEIYLGEKMFNFKAVDTIFRKESALVHP